MLPGIFADAGDRTGLEGRKAPCRRKMAQDVLKCPHAGFPTTSYKVSKEHRDGNDPISDENLLANNNPLNCDPNFILTVRLVVNFQQISYLTVSEQHAGLMLLTHCQITTIYILQGQKRKFCASVLH